MPQVVPRSRVPDFQCIDRVVMTALRADEKPAVLLENGEEAMQSHTEAWDWAGIHRLHADSLDLMPRVWVGGPPRRR